MARATSKLDCPKIIRDIATIAIVEDEPDIADITARKIQGINSETLFQTVICHDYLSALTLLAKGNVDIFIVDIRIPKQIGHPERPQNGKLLIQTITQSTNAAVIVFSGETKRISNEDVYDLGAVGIVDKLAGVDELSAKLNSVWKLLQRNRISSDIKSRNVGSAFKIGHWQFVSGQRILSATVDNANDISLTQMEDAFLTFILADEEKTISREDIYSLVLRRVPLSNDRGHSNIVSGLRKKLPQDIRLQSDNQGFYRLIPLVSG